MRGLVAPQGIACSGDEKVVVGFFGRLTGYWGGAGLVQLLVRSIAPVPPGLF